MKQAVYYRVQNIAEALELAAGKDVEIIAGGTDLMVQRADRIKDPAGLLDITGIEELRDIRFTDGDCIIGACVTIAEIAKSDGPKIPACLRQGAQAIGSPQIRNLATLGGNICNGSPCGDTLAPLVSLEAEFVLRSLDGERRVKAGEFFTGPKMTVRKPGEILTAVVLPKKCLEGISAFRMIGKREGQAISQVNTAVWSALDGNLRIARVRAAAGSVAPVPVRLHAAEEYLTGLGYGEIERETLSEAVRKEIRPIDDVRAAGDYRASVTGQLVADAVSEIFTREGGNDEA
ncbi:MAG: FAD binding domain-containing protein [Spirochaetia bacterium]